MNSINIKREEDIKHLIQLGYTSDIVKGIVYKPNGDIINNKSSRGYILIHKRVGARSLNKSINVLAHQFIYYINNGKTVDQLDHINGIRDDNRILNLRAVNNQQNQWNQTKAKGYTWHKPTSKWRAQIKVNEKVYHLGLYDNEEEAHQAYLDAKKLHHKID